jgi:hypothetical protein
MATSTATHYRIHAAPSVGCGSCGAPLPVDPTALHVWCPMSRRWQAVPNDVRARAYEHLRATESLGAERAAQVARAAAHREAARKSKRQGTFMLFHAAFMIVPALVSFGVYAVVGSIDFLSSLSEEYEPWAVALVAVGKPAQNRRFEPERAPPPGVVQLEKVALDVAAPLGVETHGVPGNHDRHLATRAHGLQPPLTAPLEGSGLTEERAGTPCTGSRPARWLAALRAGPCRRFLRIQRCVRFSSASRWGRCTRSARRRS